MEPLRKRSDYRISDGVNVEITEGLSEGETVLIESQVTGE